MNTKIKVKFGEVEVEYEGDASYLDKGLTELLIRVAEIYKSYPVATTKPMEKNAVANSNTLLDLSTNTIASILNSKSGSELALAASARLCLVKGQEKFDRKEILEEMQSATTYFTKGHGKNLTTSLKTLTKNKQLNLSSTNTYALSGQTRKMLEEKLANHQQSEDVAA